MDSVSLNGADDIRRHDLIALHSVPPEHGLVELLQRRFPQQAFGSCKYQWHDTNLCLGLLTGVWRLCGRRDYLACAWPSDR